MSFVSFFVLLNKKPHEERVVLSQKKKKEKEKGRDNVDVFWDQEYPIKRVVLSFFERKFSTD